MSTTRLSPLASPGKPYSFTAKTTSGVTTIVASMVFETDETFTISVQKVVSVVQAAETDAAQNVTAVRYVPIVQVTETDLAQAVAIARGVTVGQTNETDIAQTITAVRYEGVGQAQETESAQPITPGGATGIGTWTSRGPLFTYRNADNVGVSYGFVFQMQATAGRVNARLYDETSGLPVIDSDAYTESPTFVQVPTTPTALSFANGHGYRAQFARSTGGTGNYRFAAPVLV